MGFYIEGPLHRKADHIIQTEDAIELAGADAAREAFSNGMGVICVVENGPFDAAAFAFSSEELEVFANPSDSRPKRWLAMDRERAEELSGFATERD